MKLLTLLTTTLFTALPATSTPALAPRADPVLGGCKLYTNTGCIAGDVLTFPLLGGANSRSDLVINTCYDAPQAFKSFNGYPISVGGVYEPDECSFRAFYAAGCKGPYVANQAADEGFSGCYNVRGSPLRMGTCILEAGARSFMFACGKAVGA
ncbi:hypothetical protein M011DRAFT_460356 [Sporormia fimetaria CBS 119925]|uniref:Cyanovirin-N domain-containing protein n=1 Tax=Sporormia fimetaria CBS 119925 TaxID=1340428 RepID=A0A6A6V783_9PLEO|nr:hypothetical protein M011DRAFT_460356 [Sporormia fimetaria CBS 119925]